MLEFVPVDFTVPGTVPALMQPTGNTCWATVATILTSWRNATTLGRPDVMQQADTNSGGAFDFAGLFSRDQGLPAQVKPGFLNALGMQSEPPSDPTVNGLAGLLEASGPLWVTTNEGTTQQFSIHARVLTAIAGDGSPDATFLTLIDPADGGVQSESVTDFVTKLDQVAICDLGAGADLRDSNRALLDSF